LVVRPIHGENMLQRQTGPVTKLLAAALLATLAAACSTPVPKPAMVPLGQTGDFGYSERDVGTDRIEVTYTGANLRVSSSQGKNDSRMVAEAGEDPATLAIWRAAQIADQRGMAAMKIENEARDTDVQVTRIMATAMARTIRTDGGATAIGAGRAGSTTIHISTSRCGALTGRRLRR
jgi:hypothetical protein